MSEPMCGTEMGKTFPSIALEPHRQRVLIERDELDEKRLKLAAFLESQMVQSLDPAEQRRLVRQEWIMQQYADVLTERIAAFVTFVTSRAPAPPPAEPDESRATGTRLTTDPNHPGLVKSNDTEPRDQAPTYLVLSEAERAKGFVRPLRFSYKHTACGVVTEMGQAIAETYARDPKFYGGTYCCGCRKHLPVSEFTWTPSGEVVGS